MLTNIFYSVQDQGVMATIKHFIANEQEMWREYNVIQPGYSANIGTFYVTVSLTYQSNHVYDR